MYATPGGDLNTKTGAPTAAKKRGYRVPADPMNADPRFLKLGYLYTLTTALSEIGYFISSQLKISACNNQLNAGYLIYKVNSVVLFDF